MASSQMSDVLHIVTSEATRLGTFLSGLAEQDWTRQSACEGWVVGDVVAHLSIAAGTWANSITRAVADDSGPPQGQMFLAPGERGSETTAQAARSAFEQGGTKLLEGFASGYGRLDRVLSTLSAEDWEKPCFHRRGPMPVREYVSLRVQELAVHGWDIRSGLDETAELSEESLPLLVGRVPRWLMNAFQPGLDLPALVRYRFDVAGPVPVNEDVVVNGINFQTEPSGPGDADVVFRCNTGNYILLIYGRLPVPKGIETGRLTVEGNRDRASDFTQWFRGF